jgi:hypothetical protein
MWIVWPAFLVAGFLEMLIFALVDPGDIHWFGQPLDFSSQTIYTIAFFIFWGAAMGASALTTLLAMSPFEVNRCPIPEENRPNDCSKKHSCGT